MEAENPLGLNNMWTPSHDQSDFIFTACIQNENYYQFQENTLKHLLWDNSLVPWKDLSLVLI